jgi:tetratricopeptide (TPR) repeat protein
MNIYSSYQDELEFMISVSMRLDENNHLPLGLIELNAPELHDMVGKQYGKSSTYIELKSLTVFLTEKPLALHEDHPNLLLRTKILLVENVQEFISGSNQQTTQSNKGKTIQKLGLDGMDALSNFHNHGNLQSLEEAISKFEAAADMTPESDPDLLDILNNLGTSFLCRFEQLGRVADINNAIERLEMAVSHTPDGDPNKHTRLNNLGNALLSRFDRLGDMSDLIAAIAQVQLAVNLAPDGHPHKPAWLNSLASSLQSRFEWLGDLSDLDNAIVQQQSAINLTPDGHPDKPAWLSNLGNALHCRFGRLGNMSDLDNAITQGQSAINLTPDGHPHKAMYLCNLGNSLHSRFERLGNMSDLDAAITQKQSAINLTPDGHPHKLGYLNNLVISLQSRFERLGDLSDLDNAIVLLQLAVSLTPNGHPNKPSWLTNLGAAFETRFLRLCDTHDAEVAINHLSASAQSPVGSRIARLKAVQKWISIASLAKHPSLLNAYECAVGLMPIVAWFGLPIRDKHEHLAQMSEIARDAAAAAISLKKYDKALEWLEQARSIVWNQALQLRTPVDKLREVNSDLADRLLRVSRTLDRGIEETGSFRSTEEDAQRSRALTMERELILNEIRSLPNFEGFLKPLRASRLREVAQNGPVVVVNIAKKRCDALALVPGIEEVIHIPLPDITPNRVIELRDELKDHLHSNGIRTRGEKAAQRWTDDGDSNDCGDILAELWDVLAKPVLESLALSVGLISTLTPRMLTMLSPASSKCTTTSMVVLNRTTRAPPDTRRRHI